MMQKVSLTDIQNALTPNYIRVSQIIYFSIIMGVTVFFLIIVFMYMQGQGAEAVSEEAIEAVNRFSLIHAALFTGALFLSSFMYNRFLREDRIESMTGGMKPDDGASAACGYLAVVRTAKIIQVAIIEAAVFFGLVTCFIAVTNRVLYQHPLYWANTLSYVIFIIFLIRDFPGKDRLMELFKGKLKFLLQY
ncbi:MAG TPA: hypothetical protein PLM53_16075 [Spirochaetota bacterium]|nr:hypothetical protein [Spirochaetota bacterium]HPC42919.1 hypothetical protein [Spirochaetota bacterium]HPL18347.1 hypothetical protein [Spirochaetota bacterium]HQF10019.1 hypothetical protein [Spirochaetota bacterium]HQH98615.1 hypothetical protein [Spirochaetota bacterium]